MGVCSWSLRPANAKALVEAVRACALEHIQLALGPILSLDEPARTAELSVIKEAGLVITATMISFDGEDYSSIATIRRTGGFLPDETWDARREITVAAAKLTQSLGVTKMSTHVGFIPPPNHEGYAVALERIAGLCQELAPLGVELLMETGQEPASELLQFINNLNSKNIGVNFDPANMILYGEGNPVDAVKMLGRHIKHVHIKDAVRSARPGIDWGSEVPFGDGEVPHKMFIETLEKLGYAGPLVIEREAGDKRVEDVKYAIETLATL